MSEHNKPIARIMEWCGPVHYEVPHGGLCARTYEEFAKGAGENGGYWKESYPLYFAPADINERITNLEAMVAERDAMLGKRPCQNSRCDELRAARALLYEIFWNGNLEEGSKVHQELDGRLGAYLDACDTLEGK